MKFKKTSLDTIASAVIALAIVISFSFLLWVSSENNKDVKNLKQSINVLEQRLVQSENIVTALVDGNEKLAVDLESEKVARAEAEKNAEESVRSIALLQADVATQKATLEASDLTKLINNWSPRVVRVECELSRADGTIRVSKASGVVTVNASGTEFITNKHVVEEGKIIANSCLVLSYDEKMEYEVSDIKVDLDSDLAYLRLNKYTNFPQLNSLVKKCTTPPNIGDQVVILGYPSVGSKDSITATDGIISGLDKKYYITSAKIERGNSGGGAIHLKNDCLLGLPTLVVAGQVESLARILAL